MRLLLTWPMLVAVIAGAAEEGYSLDDLVRRPPFGAVTKPTTGDTVKIPKESYELRGFFGRGRDMMVSVRDNAKGESLWLKFTDKTAKWRLLTADVSAGKASVEIDGRVFDLKLGKTDGLPLPVTGATSIGASPVTPVSNVPLYRGAPAVVAPPPSVEPATIPADTAAATGAPAVANVSGNPPVASPSIPEKPAGRP